MKERPEDTFIDWATYFAIIRAYRIKNGFSHAREFRKAIKDRTGVDIPEQTYYKLEQGKQAPTGIQIFAINYTLNENFSNRWKLSACKSL